MEEKTAPRASSIRWKILRQALLRPSSRHLPEEQQSQLSIDRVSRKAAGGFGLIPFKVVEHSPDESGSSPVTRGSIRADGVVVCYTLPIETSPKLLLTQRVDNRGDLHDFKICNQYNIDNTGLVCLWPSEEVLAYFCLSNPDIFRSKRVIELGSGYGLAGFVIAAASEASEVIISDGNPQVVDYIQHNVEANSTTFGSTKVKPMMLHWNQSEISSISNSFDIIVSSDCTFFKEFHGDLARTVKSLLKKGVASEAIFLNPRRGDSLDKFLEEIELQGLHFTLLDNYDAKVWKRHQDLMSGDDDSWPGYVKDHCYPLMLRITHQSD